MSCPGYGRPGPLPWTFPEPSRTCIVSARLSTCQATGPANRARTGPAPATQGREDREKVQIAIAAQEDAWRRRSEKLGLPHHLLDVNQTLRPEEDWTPGRVLNAN